MVKIEKRFINYKSNPWGWQESNGYDDLGYHNTANDATAEQEWSFLNSRVSTGEGYATYHLVVDETKAIQCMPYEVDAWAVSDGTGKGGNTTDIHIEIARSTDSEHYPKAFANAMEVGAQICKELGWKPEGRINFHYDYGTKYCPHHSLDDFGGDGYVGSTASESAANKLRNHIVSEINKILNESEEYPMKKLADNFSRANVWEDEQVRWGGKYKIQAKKDLKVKVYYPDTDKMTDAGYVLPKGKFATTDYGFHRKDSDGKSWNYHVLVPKNPLNTKIECVCVNIPD